MPKVRVASQSAAAVPRQHRKQDTANHRLVRRRQDIPIFPLMAIPALSPASHLSRVAVAAVVLCACGDAGARDAGEPVALFATDTLVTTASERIGGVYDLAVSPAGVLYVADWGYKHVLGIDPDGATRTIGTEGSGPGEFEMPYTVGADDDSIRVFDAARNVVQVFDRAGALIRSYRLDAPGLGGGRAFSDDGWLAATIGGFEDAMVLLLDAAGARKDNVGEPMVPPTRYYDFGAIKTQIGEGRVPDAFRNQAMVAWGPDHSLYLAFLAEPEVRRYDGTGRLLWTRTLDEPVLRAARNLFFQRNLEESDPSRLHPLRYVTDVGAADGHLWLLLNTADEEAGLLLVLDRDDGAIRCRFAFPGLPNTGTFVVDGRRGRLYMAPRGDASVVAFDLPVCA